MTVNVFLNTLTKFKSLYLIISTVYLQGVNVLPKKPPKQSSYSYHITECQERGYPLQQYKPNYTVCKVL